jgi:myo-inositol-1(or 4)-monophosphatase
MSDPGPLEVLVEAAREGERAFMAARARTGVHARTKSSPADLVTEVDVRVQEALVEFLRRRLPQAAIVAEEAPAVPARETLYIDPVDGTLNFVHGFGEHAISIGYWRAGQGIAGVVLKPSTGDVFTAEAGKGAWRNGTPMRVSPHAALGEGLVATGWPYDKARTEGVLHQMRAVIPRCQEIRILGSAALALCYVAAGILEGFWETGLEPWDMAAGVVIAEAAGARVTGFGGEPFRLEAGAILASNGQVHETISTILSNAY